MRRPVVAAQSGAVHAKRDVQSLNRHVVNGHVVSALEERGINRQKRFQSLRSKSAGEERCMLFRDSDIVVTVGMRFLKMGEASSTRHRRRDRNNFAIGVSEFGQRLTDRLGISRCWRGRGLTGLEFVFAATVNV